MPRTLARLLKPLAALALSLVLVLGLAADQAARDTNSYDGNIYALYAGNGSWCRPAPRSRKRSKSTGNCPGLLPR